MQDWLRDREHLIRVAGLFVGGLLAFLFLRALFIPTGFGVYGHFRAGALPDNRARPVAYAGRATCEGCHTDVADARKGSKHQAISCESCHGPLAAHAEDPGAVKPNRPDPRQTCLVCHTANVAKPAAFPQVNPREHAESGACVACHQAHRPEEPPKEGP